MLIDAFGRHINYLRVSVTDRCDMRCSYCMPVGFRDFEEPEDWLRLEESARLVRIFSELGVNKIRITGGEPLLRKGVVDFARAYASNAGVQDLSLSTNGSLLARFADQLKQAGVKRLNVSLDTLDAKKFAEITKRDALPAVLAGIQAAKVAGFDVIKLNAVVQADTSEDDIEALLDYAVSNGFVLRQPPTGLPSWIDCLTKEARTGKLHGRNSWRSGRRRQYREPRGHRTRLLKRGSQAKMAAISLHWSGAHWAAVGRLRMRTPALIEWKGYRLRCWSAPTTNEFKT